MEKIRFVHTADFHLGSSFSRFPGQAETLKKDQIKAFLAVSQYCQDENIPLLLIAGDLFEDPWPQQHLVHEVKDILAAMPATQVFIASGNHDPAEPDSPWLATSWPANVHLFTGPMHTFELPDLQLKVHGAGFRSTASSAPLIDPASVFSLHPDWMHILLLHGELIRGSQNSVYNPIDESWLRRSGFDYAALGHVHQGFTPRRLEDAGPWHAYPGCPAGRGFDELDSKGILAGSLTKVRRPGNTSQAWRVECEASFQPVATRAFRSLSVDVGDCSSLSDIQERIEDKIEHDSKLSFADAFKIELTGEVPASRNWSLTLLEARLRERLFHLKLTDSTREPINLKELVREHSLQGAFARQILENDPVDFEKLSAEKKKLLTLGLKALDQEVIFREDS